MNGPYDDIIHLPHHTSPTRAHMPRADRAAQFSPFAALSGHEAAICETARRTEECPILADDRREELDRKLQMLADWLPEPVQVTVTWFCPDSRKTGGRRVTATGNLRGFDRYRGCMLLTDKREIPIKALLDIQSPLFGAEE